MKLIFVFTMFLIQIIWLHLFKIMEIVRTFGIDTFVYTEKLTVFLGNQGIAAMRAGKSDGSCNNFTGTECLTTDFTLVLPIASIVVVDVMVWSTTQRADGILRNRFTVTTLNRVDRFAILPLIVFEKELPVLFDKGLDDRKFINLEFLVLGRMGIIESPLSERDISANKVKKPTVLLVKVLNCLK